MNVSSCPQGPPQESSGRQSCMMQAGRSPQLPFLQPWRLYIWPGRANRPLGVFQYLAKDVLFERKLSSSCLPWSLGSSSAGLGLGCFHFAGKKPKAKEVLLLIDALGWSLGIPLSSPLVSLWHHATGKESHTEISHRYLLGTYSVPDTKGAKPSSLLSGAYPGRVSADPGGIPLHCGPDSLIYLMWWSVGYPVSWGLT